jgi:hypothetical protein
MRHGLIAGIVALAIAEAVAACSLCQGGGFGSRPSLRQEALQAKHVYYGTLSNPRINAANAGNAANSGATDFTVSQVVKSSSEARKAQQQITIPRFVPVNPKDPPKFVVFCDENNGQLDPYRGTPVKSEALIEYLRGATAIDAKDTTAILEFAGRHLDHIDADVASEAFLELARADDPAVLAAAKRMDPKRIRKLIDDPQTPVERLGLYAYLLGACGTPAEAEWIKTVLKQPGDRFRGAMSGLYAGLIMIAPAEGWVMLNAILADTKRPYNERSAALNAVRFYRNANPQANRVQILAGLKALLPQGDIADLAVEDLRRWQMWELSPEVTALFGVKSHDAPLMKRAILRYALSCPDQVSKQMVATVRTTQPDLVKEVEESLQYEKSP